MVQIRVKDIKSGDMIVEFDYGERMEMIAIEDAHFVNEDMRQGWVCKVWHGTDPLELFENPAYPAYQLDLWKV